MRTCCVALALSLVALSAADVSKIPNHGGSNGGTMTDAIEKTTENVTGCPDGYGRDYVFGCWVYCGCSKGHPCAWCCKDDGQHCYRATSTTTTSTTTDPCPVNSVTGKWVPKFTVAAPSVITFKHGTTKTVTNTLTFKFSAEVTAKVEVSFQIKAYKITASVEAKIGFEMTDAYSTEWQVNNEEDFEVTFSQDDVGKFVWQFEFQIDAACDAGLNTVTKEFAVTSGAWEEPCCVPGFCTDAPRCNKCHDALHLLPGADPSRCGVGPSPSPDPPAAQSNLVMV